MRKPAASTLLKQANTEIADLKKQLESAKSQQKYSADRNVELERELNDVHVFLDTVTTVTRDAENYGPRRSAMTRLCAWLASK